MTETTPALVKPDALGAEWRWLENWCCLELYHGDNLRCWNMERSQKCLITQPVRLSG